MLVSIFLESAISVRHCFPYNLHISVVLTHKLYNSICLYIIISYHPANGLMLSVRLLLQIMGVLLQIMGVD